ncbi:hypothetical protein FXO38_21095 [Capsicum annuum]|nr:hypothetical protein FXO38_21095 [Capsicum annuum]KAF3645586.1 hypothetical protein FXO37_20884 [Capsicum annuum]
MKGIADLVRREREAKKRGRIAAGGGGRSGGGTGVVAPISDGRLVVLGFTREDGPEAGCMAVAWWFLWSISDEEIGGGGDQDLEEFCRERRGQREGLSGDDH